MSVRTGIGCRRTMNGNTPLAAGRAGNGFRGAIRSHIVRRTIIATATVTTSARRAAIIQITTMEKLRTRVRAEHFRRTDTGCATWLEMCGSGAILRRARPGLFGAGVGATTRASRGAVIGARARRAARATTSVCVLSAVKFPHSLLQETRTRKQRAESRLLLRCG